MSPAEALVAIFVLFGLPASIVWVVFRYKTLEKGLRGGGGGGARGRLAPAAQERLESLEKDKKLLEERVRNLESIVCSVDLELNARLNRLAAQPTVAQAVPSIAPGSATQFFHKTECFCFTPQSFTGDQTRELTVRFIVDPKLPHDVDRLTLAYALYTVPSQKVAQK